MKHVPRLLRILSNEIDKNRKMIKSRVWNVAEDCAVNSQINFPDEVIID